MAHPAWRTGLLLALCAFAAAVSAQAPAPLLEQYLAQFRQAKDNFPEASAEQDAIRADIVRLVREMPSAPSVPSQFDELVGGASYRFKNAQSRSDFIGAARAFHEASRVAPWLPEPYFNAGLALEKARLFDAAIRQFNLYLAVAPDAADARAVRQRIGGLRVAAREAPQAATRQYIDRLRPLFVGYYVNYSCEPPGRAGQGCSVPDTAAGYWVNLQNQYTVGLEDDVIVVRHMQGGLLYRGTVECQSDELCFVDWKDSQGGQVWGQVKEGFCGGKPYASLYISWDRPVDIPAGNDHLRFHYWLFDKPKDWC
jgi:tetratricopeptide (TPR) repeat protein